MKKILLVILILTHSAVAKCDTANENFFSDFVEAAKDRATKYIIYNGSYFSIPYPNGDVPSNIGVCTDVVIRSFRKVDIDLQKEVHEDMLVNFDAYPSKKNWGLNKPDKNIDHRRVPNLRVFFERNGVSLKISKDPKKYLPGDLVTWMLPSHSPHIGVVVDRKSADGKTPLIVHNIGAGPKINDILFNYPITGHYRYRGR